VRRQARHRIGAVDTGAIIFVEKPEHREVFCAWLDAVKAILEGHGLQAEVTLLTRDNVPRLAFAYWASVKAKEGKA